MAKVGQIEIMKKYPDKIRICLKRKILRKYFPTHFVKTFLKRVHEEINKSKYQKLTYGKPNPA